MTDKETPMLNAILIPPRLRVVMEDAMRPTKISGVGGQFTADSYDEWSNAVVQRLLQAVSADRSLLVELVEEYFQYVIKEEVAIEEFARTDEPLKDRMPKLILG